MTSGGYRSPACAHCRIAAAVDQCEVCGLWICPACRARGCERGRLSWTGECRGCGAPYPDDQRRDVVEDGDGELVCHKCGSSYRLRRLRLIEESGVVNALRAGLEPCEVCGHADEPQDLLVLHDRAWGRRGGSQALYHLLCVCGRVRASTAAREER